VGGYRNLEDPGEGRGCKLDRREWEQFVCAFANLAQAFPQRHCDESKLISRYLRRRRSQTDSKFRAVDKNRNDAGYREHDSRVLEHL